MNLPTLTSGPTPFEQLMQLAASLDDTVADSLATYQRDRRAFYDQLVEVLIAVRTAETETERTRATVALRLLETQGYALERGFGQVMAQAIDSRCRLLYGLTHADTLTRPALRPA